MVGKLKKNKCEKILDRVLQRNECFYKICFVEDILPPIVGLANYIQRNENSTCSKVKLRQNLLGAFHIAYSIGISYVIR